MSNRRIFVLPLLLLMIAASPPQEKPGEDPLIRQVLEQARQAAELIKDESAEQFVLPLIARAQADAGDNTGALKTAEMISHAQIKVQMLRTIAAAQARAGDIVGTRQTVERVQAGPPPDDLAAEIATAQAVAGDMEGALKTARSIADAWFRAAALREIGVAQAKAGDRDAAATSFKEAIHVAEALPHDVALGVGTGNSRTGALHQVAVTRAKLGDWKGAIEAADAIRIKADPGKAPEHAATDQPKSQEQKRYALLTAEGYAEQSRTYTVSQIVEMQIEKGDVHEAIRLADTLAGDWAKSLSVKIAPAFAAAGDRAGAANRLNEALKIARAREGEYGQSLALKDIAAAYAKLGDRDTSKQIFEESVQVAASVKQEYPIRFRALEHIAHAQLEVGDIDGAIRTADHIRDYASERDRNLTGLAKAHAEAGDVKAALQLTERIKDPATQAYTLAQIAAAQANAGNITEAKSNFQRARRVADGLRENAETLLSIARAEIEAGEFDAAYLTANAIKNHYSNTGLGDIATALAKRGDLERAIQTVDAITDAYHKAYVLFQIAKEQANAGKIEAAFQTARRIEDRARAAGALSEIAMAQARAGDVAAALATAEPLTEPWAKAPALREIALAQAKAGDRATATRTFQRAVEAARPVDVQPNTKAMGGGAEVTSGLLREIAVAQVKAGDLQGAIQLAKSLKAEFEKSHALSEVARVQAEAGDIKGAIDTSGQITHSHYRGTALLAIANAQAKTGDQEAAERSFRQIVEDTEVVKKNNSMVVGMVQVQVVAGDVKGAFYTANALTNEGTKVAALHAIALAQAKAGDVDGALETAGAIKADDSRIAAWREIAVRQAKRGDRAGAARTFQQALELADADLGDPKVLADIAGAQMKSGERAAAAATLQKALRSVESRSYGMWTSSEVGLGLNEKDHILQLLAKAKAEAGDVEGAMEIAKNMPSSNGKTMAMWQIAKAEAAAGAVKEAIERANGLTSQFQKSLTLVGVARGILEQKDTPNP